MQKIPTIFKRNYETYQVLPEINPGCEWVFAGLGKVYRKYQGMAAMIEDGKLYKRCIIKKNKPVPESFILCTLDPRSGKQFGWLPISRDNPQDKHYINAFHNLKVSDPNMPNGTYELVGPKIHGNPEDFYQLTLVKHTAFEIFYLERTYKDIKTFLFYYDYEGLVFHNSDGQMAKIKKKDFGLI